VPSSHTARDYTVPDTPVPDGPLNADQLAPSQRAILFTVTPPAVMKLPPT
jgi:hypothetical protein